MIECIAGGLVYRNPKPHLRAVHAFHPTIVRLHSGEFVAGFDLGQAMESFDYRTYVCRSNDDCRSWSEPAPLLGGPLGPGTTHTIRISRLADGTLLGFGAQFHRSDPEQGLVNRENLGYVPVDLVLTSSANGGRDWSKAAIIDPPLVGPAFETCHAIRELSDGRLLAPTSTWKRWDGTAPDGMNAVALVSHDRGRTWPEYLKVMSGYHEGIIYWEQSLIELPNHRLLAVAWAFHEETGKSLPNRYAISNDGKSFSAPRLTGFHGQTAKIVSLGGDRVLTLYRREDKPGLWANLCRIAGDEWINMAEHRVWHGAPSGMSGQAPAGDELSALRFGFPSMTLLPDGDVLAVFWCYEDCVSGIRWVRLRVSS
jgi:hypothetical protein